MVHALGAVLALLTALYAFSTAASVQRNSDGGSRSRHYLRPSKRVFGHTRLEDKRNPPWMDRLMNAQKSKRQKRSVNIGSAPLDIETIARLLGEQEKFEAANLLHEFNLLNIIYAPATGDQLEVSGAREAPQSQKVPETPESQKVVDKDSKRIFGSARLQGKRGAVLQSQLAGENTDLERLAGQSKSRVRRGAGRFNDDSHNGLRAAAIADRLWKDDGSYPEDELRETEMDWLNDDTIVSIGDRFYRVRIEEVGPETYDRKDKYTGSSPWQTQASDEEKRIFGSARILKP